MQIDIGIFLASLLGKSAIVLVFAAIACLAFLLPKPREVASLIKSNLAYRTMFGGLVVGQLIASSALAYQPWNNWTKFWIWEVGGNLFVILVLLIVRFVVLDPIILRKVNNLEAIKNGNLAVAVVEGTTYVGVGFMLKAIFSGEAPTLGYSLSSTGIYSAVSIALLAGWYLWDTRASKQHFRVNGKPASLNTALAANNMVAGAKAASAIMFFSIIQLGALMGNFTNWSESIQAYVITTVVGVAIAFGMNSVLNRYTKWWGEQDSTTITLNGGEETLIAPATTPIVLTPALKAGLTTALIGIGMTVLAVVAAGIVTGAMATAAI